MKKLIFLSVFIFVAFSCSNNDEVSNPILAKWQGTEYRSLYYLDTEWSIWGTNISTVKYLEFVDGSNAKYHLQDGSQMNGTYTYNVETCILTTNFPEGDFPTMNYKVIQIDNNSMTLENDFVNYTYQTKYVKVVQ